MLFARQDRKLVGRIERVRLFLAARVEESFADDLSLLDDAAVLLAVVDESAVAEVGKAQ